MNFDSYKNYCLNQKIDKKTTQKNCGQQAWQNFMHRTIALYQAI